MIWFGIRLAAALALCWFLFRLLMWDTQGISPDETLTPQQRQRVEAMRVEEGGLCCCDIHQPWMCEVHASEGEALPPGAA